ncbi:hypothetical protein BLNAU_23994 [Blattamonas nauphoetae]|uniref:Uncharacterized protein n=1 Tax=Blattamonas nauphoetae TaxID=2049346 RepID=A0ABQ9WNP2_9EUKA|nr:hypothetical protein BLNAU_23994 [Blattamonas nauphoetae]
MHVTVNVISRRTPPTPVSKLMPQLFLVNEDAASSIAVRFLLAVILLVRQYLNTQRITHVVICGTGTTFLASPAKHVSRVCSFLDKALDGDGVILLVSGACDGSDVAEPADSDEGIVRIVHSAQHVVQPGSATGSVCAECAYCSESEVPLLTGATSEPTSGTEPAGSILQSGDARRHRMPLNACRTYTPLGLDVPQINVQNVPAQLLGHATILELMEAGNRNCQLFGQSNKTPSDGKDRPGTTPERHARPPTLSQVSSAASLDSLASSSRVDSPTPALPAALLAHTAHPSVGSGQQHRPLSPLVAHTHKPPFASEGPRELERATESCSCDDAPVLAREWDALAATLEASPKVGLAPHNPSHTLPLFPITRKCAFCECEEDNTDNIRREGEGCGCEAEAPFLIVSPIGLGGSAVVVRSLSFARHHLAVLFCAESRSASQNMFTEEQIVVPDRVVPVCTDLSTSSH